MNKANNKYRDKRKFVTAIFFSPVKTGDAGGNFLKYRGIRDDPKELERFENNIRRMYPTVVHVNYYSMATRTYLRQKRF